MSKTAIPVGVVLVLASSFAVVVETSGASPNEAKIPPLKLRALPVPRTAVLRDPDWHIWGGSAIRGENGKYHLFYSRWPRENKRRFGGWLFDSEIARAVADRPLGPYKYVETVLRGRGGDHWDAVTAHNPHIKRFNGRYYLYYLSTHDGNDRATDQKDHQYSQRIGVAVADHLEGPWRRFDKPLLEPQAGGAIHQYVTNPSITQGRHGQYLMMFKGKPAQDPTGNALAHGVAFGKSPLGPFRIHSQPLLTEYYAEDAYVWYDRRRDRYFALFKDRQGKYSHSEGGIAMITSVDGLSWHMAANPLVSKRRIVWQDGTVQPLVHLERPQLLFDEQGRPSVLFAAAASSPPFKTNQPTFNVHIPLQCND